jgi:hypothetical protein
MRFGSDFWALLPLTMLFLLPFTTPVSYGASRTVGVSVGNSFKQSVAFSWSSTDPNAIMPSYYAGWNETEWMSVLIIDVSGTNVSAQTTIHFKNGSDLVQVGVTDIDTGNGNWTTWIIAANLNLNDTIYTSSMSTYLINETIPRDYPGGSRSTNHLNITTELNTTDSYLYNSRNNYWDRETGFMVEGSDLQISKANTFWTNVSFSATLTESDVWVVPEFPTFTLILAVLILLAAAVVFSRKRLPKTLTY